MKKLPATALLLAISGVVAVSGTAFAKYAPVDRSLTEAVPADAPIAAASSATQREVAYFNAQPAYGQIFQCAPRDMVFFTGLIRYARACD